MNKIYENIYIGNFIFACGKYAGFTEGKSSVNLYQQTPTDKYIGDLMMTNNAIHFILEFKKSEADIITELNKPNRINLEKNMTAYDNLNELSPIRNISKKAHFLAFPDKGFQLNFCSYYNYFYSSMKNEYYNFNSFLSEFYDYEKQNAKFDFDLLEDGPKVGVNTDDFIRYINFLNQDNNSDVSGSIRGLIISITKDKQFLLSPFKGIKQLSLMLQLPIPRIISIEEAEKISEIVHTKSVQQNQEAEKIQIKQ